jgi:hypothetical protein
MRRILGCILLSVVLGPPRPSQATDYQFTTIDVPFARTQATSVVGLSAVQGLIGAYLDAGNRDQGFLQVQGTFVTLLNVVPQAVNTAGAIVGFYTSDKLRGFVFQDGTFTPLEFPAVGVPPQFSLLTEAEGINDAGVIVGDYRDGQGTFHSFQYDPTATPRYQSFDPPWPHTGSGATGINNGGVIVGIFFDAQGLHGYLKDGDTWTMLNAPGAVTTEPVAINDAGQIVGLADGSTFVFDGTTFTTVVHPDGGLTQAHSISQTGVLVGRYLDTQGVDHGFLATPQAGIAPPAGAARAAVQGASARLLVPLCGPGNRRWSCRHP